MLGPKQCHQFHAVLSVDCVSKVGGHAIDFNDGVLMGDEPDAGSGEFGKVTVG